MEVKEIEEEIEKSLGIMIYFSGTNCSVCKVLKPKIEEEFTKHFPKIKQIYLEDKDKEIYAHFNIFSVPTTLLFFEGKEFFRKSRNISIMGFIEEVKRPYMMLMGDDK